MRVLQCGPFTPCRPNDGDNYSRRHRDEACRVKGASLVDLLLLNTNVRVKAQLEVIIFGDMPIGIVHRWLNATETRLMPQARVVQVHVPLGSLPERGLFADCQLSRTVEFVAKCIPNLLEMVVSQHSPFIGRRLWGKLQSEPSPGDYVIANVPNEIGEKCNDIFIFGYSISHF
ncbi:MAG: hypothetical protein GY739_05930 [Mesoflavibacter sp.]|nr:hypothetical protein [Mesoflavibacter sp.]